MKCLNGRLIIFTFFLITACFYCLGIGQSRILRFSDFEKCENIDYSSFYPSMLLQHTISEFRKIPKNPIEFTGKADWDSQDAADPFVWVTADSITLFYDGSRSTQYEIGYALLDKKGWFWERNNLIAWPGISEWEKFHRISPAVLHHPDKLYLFYSGNDKDVELGYRIGFIFKTATGKWDRVSQHPLVVPGESSWDNNGAAYADVIYLPEKQLFRMYYTGFSGPLASIGFKESRDAVTWTESPGMSCLNIPPGVIAPEVVYNGKQYSMYFTRLYLNPGPHTKICRAVSDDGIRWENVTDILVPEKRWEGRRLMRPNISFFEQRFHLFYSGQKSSRWRIGEAVASGNFASRGIWRSKSIAGAFNEIRIKYENPIECRLQCFIIYPNTGERIELPLAENRIEFRTDVFLSKFPDFKHTNLKSNDEFKLELNFISTDNRSTPVIYEIRLNK